KAHLHALPSRSRLLPQSLPVIEDSNDRAAANVTKAGVQVCVFPCENALRDGRGNLTRACENRTPAQIRTCSLPNLVATGAALALLLENTGVRPFGLAVERGRRVDDGSKTTRARWVGRRRAADFVASRAVGPSRHGHAEAAPLRCPAAQKAREQYCGRDRCQCTLGHCSLSLSCF